MSSCLISFSQPLHVYLCLFDGSTKIKITNNKHNLHTFTRIFHIRTVRLPFVLSITHIIYAYTRARSTRDWRGIIDDPTVSHARTNLSAFAFIFPINWRARSNSRSFGHWIFICIFIYLLVLLLNSYVLPFGLHYSLIIGRFGLVFSDDWFNLLLEHDWCLRFLPTTRARRDSE